MTNEEKAKAYDEALEVMRQWIAPCHTKEQLDTLKKSVFPELAESKEESIRKSIIHILQVGGYMSPEEKDKAFAYLEKQKENAEKEYVFRPLAGTDITIATEQAIRRANEGDRLVLAFNGAYIPVRKGCNANQIVDIYDAYLEKQKDASKAIEAVERIDKYIDEHLANAHDMKDSDPEKKYYRGWDDALGKMAGILQDVYSVEKKKESLRDFIDDFPYSVEKEQNSTESEDEKIRARLYEYFQKFLKGHEDCYEYGGYVKWEDLDVKSILAWLEKQKIKEEKK